MVDAGTPADLPLSIVVDTNVVLHCKPLAELPWEQFGVAQVDVVLVDPVLNELDAWKGKGNDARAKRVRSMLPLLRQLLEANNLVIELAHGSCRVRLRMPSAALHGANASADADGAIVAAAERLATEGGPVMLVTRDVVMALRAHRRGITYRLLPPEDAAWNLRPEPVDVDHAETVRKLKEYERQRPELSAVASGLGLEVSDTTLTALVPHIPDKFDMTSVISEWAKKEFMPPRWKNRDLSDTSWNNKLRSLEREFLISMLKRLRFGPIVELVIRNGGSVNADDVQIEVIAEGDWKLRSQWSDISIDVPAPPREREYDHNLITVPYHHLHIPNTPVTTHRDDEPTWIESEDEVMDGTSRLVAHIPVLRHRSQASLFFHVGPLPESTAPGKLVVRISSARQPGFEMTTWSLVRNAPNLSMTEAVEQLLANGELVFHPKKG